MAYLLKPLSWGQAFDYDRGLFQSKAYGLGRGLAAPVSVNSGFVRAGPEAETDCIVNASQLSPNSDVSLITAKLRVSRLPEENPPTSSEVIVNGPSGELTYGLQSSGGAVAENIALRLDGGDVFWQLPSSGQGNEFQIPDFAGEVNNYLNRLDAPSGEVSLKFLVAAAVPINVKIVLDEVASSNIVTQIWENPLDQTFRKDRNLAVRYGETLTPSELNLDILPDGASLTHIELDLSGEFDEPRVLGSIVSHDDGFFATVNKDFAIAQQFENAFKTRMEGVCLDVLVESEAEIFLAIHVDEFGSPGAEALASTTLTVTPEEEIRGAWRSGMLDTPIDVESGVAYWLVVKGVRGDASVCVGPQQWKALGEFLINRGGQRWKPISDDRGMSALIRPIYSPDVDHQTAAVEIEVQADARVLGSQRIDPWADVRRLSLPVIGDKVRSASLVIKSSAAGSLTLANVVQRYTH